MEQPPKLVPPPAAGAPGQQGMPDAVFAAFYESLDDFAPTLPDGLTEHYLASCGVLSPDHRFTRLISLAAQQFVAEVAEDAAAVARQRQGGPGKGKDPDRLVLTTEVLAHALEQKGVRVAAPPYYSAANPPGR